MKLMEEIKTVDDWIFLGKISNRIQELKEERE